MATLAAYLQERLSGDGFDLDEDQIQGYLDDHASLVENEDSAEVETVPAKSKMAAKSKVAKTVAPKSKAVAPKSKVAAKTVAPKSKAAAPKSKATATKTKAKEEAHTCERLIKGKDGERICGRNAKNELNDMWYCGTEKSGCYSSAVKAAASAVPKAKTSAKTSAKAKGKVAPPVVNQKVVKREKLPLTEVPEGSGIWVDLKNMRMVYSQSPKETYGILDDDDETILPLTEEAIAFAEAHNISVRVAAKKAKAAPKSKVAPAKAKAVPPGKAAKAKGKVAPPKQEEDEEDVVEDLAQDAEDVEVADDIETPDIDLGGDAEAEPEVEEEEDEGNEEDPDIEEADEGEAADDADPEEDAPEDEE